MAFNRKNYVPTSYLNMLVMSIPTNITFTGNQTLTNLHVSGSVDITPSKLNVDTIITEMKFCIQRRTMRLLDFIDTFKFFCLNRVEQREK